MTNASFWEAAWREGRIGFHRATVHPTLSAEGGRLLDDAHGVFVPLCGKTVDLDWLAAGGVPVVGVEIVEAAVAAFFAERGQTPARAAVGALDGWRAGGVTLWRGDVFDVQPAHLAGADRVWDRAALVALPPELRARYLPHLVGLLPDGARMLVSTFLYEQTARPGPPFSVDEAELRRGVGPRGRVTALGESDLIDESPRWREAGLDRFLQQDWWIEIG